MGEPRIEASYAWTLDEYLAASEAAFTQYRSAVIRYGFRFLALVLASIGGLGLYLSRARSGEQFGAFLFLCVGASVWFATSWRARRWVFVDRYRQHTRYAKTEPKITYLVDERGLRRLGVGSEASWVWELTPLVVEAPRGFLIYHQGQGHWIPNHAFTGKDDRDEFARLAALRAGRFVGKRTAAVYDPDFA